MLRDIKYLFKIAAAYIFGIPAAACAFVAAYYFLFGSNPHNGEYISGMIVAIISMMSLAVTMNLYSSFANIALSMGATRKSLFFTIQVYKIAVSLAMFAAAFLVNESLKFFYKINFFETNGGLIVCLGITLILGTLGESIGIITTRWGRIGMAIFMGVCMIFGACVGVGLTLGSEVLLNIFSFAIQGPWQSVAILAIASGIITVVNHIMYRKAIVS